MVANLPPNSWQIKVVVLPFACPHVHVPHVKEAMCRSHFWHGHIWLGDTLFALLGIHASFCFRKGMQLAGLADDRWEWLAQWWGRTLSACGRELRANRVQPFVETTCWGNCQALGIEKWLAGSSLIFSTWIVWLYRVLFLSACHAAAVFKVLWAPVHSCVGISTQYTSQKIWLL